MSYSLESERLYFRDITEQDLNEIILHRGMTPLHTQTTGRKDLMYTDIFLGIFLVAIALVLIGLSTGKIGAFIKEAKNGGKRNMEPDGTADFYLNTPVGAKDFCLKEVGKKAAEMAEKEVIQFVLEETHWNRKEAAKVLRVSYNALRYKIKKYLGMSRKDLGVGPTIMKSGSKGDGMDVFSQKGMRKQIREKRKTVSFLLKGSNKFE